MEVGEMIKKLRKQRGMKQKELAVACSMSNNALCNIEKNVAFPPKRTLNKICGVLGVPTAYFLACCLDPSDFPSDKREGVEVILKALRGIFENEDI